MKMKNRKGPKIDPCRTPHRKFLGFEFTLFIYTYCSLLAGYERNQAKVISRTQNFVVNTMINRMGNPIPEKIQHYQNLYAYTIIAINVKWPE